MPAIKWTAPKRRAFLTTLSITGGYSRPTGIQPFGVWSWGRVVDGDVDIRRASLVRLTTEHICTDALLPWQNGHVRTDIGPFPIGEN